MSPQKFKVVVEFEYEADMSKAEEVYGITDPVEMAVIDQENFHHVPMMTLELSTTPFTVKVTPVDETPEAVNAAEEALFYLACDDMPVSGYEVREAMSRWARSLTANHEAELARERKSVADLHDGLNKLFKEALRLKNENSRLKKAEGN